MHIRGWTWCGPMAVLIAVAVVGCDVSLDVEGSRFTCESDDDCATGFACEEVAGLRQCVATGSTADVDVVDVADTSEDDANDTTTTTTSDTAGPDVDTTTLDTSMPGDTSTTTMQDTVADTSMPDVPASDTGAVYFLFDIEGPVSFETEIRFEGDGRAIEPLYIPPFDRKQPELHGPADLPVGVDIRATTALDTSLDMAALAVGEVRLYVLHGQPAETGELHTAVVSSEDFGATNLQWFETVTGLSDLRLSAEGLTGSLSPTPAAGPELEARDWLLDVSVGDVLHGSFVVGGLDSTQQVWIASGDGWAERLLRVDLATRPARLIVDHTRTCRAYLDADCVDGQWCLPTTFDPDGDITGDCTTPDSSGVDGSDCASSEHCAAHHMCINDRCTPVCSVDVSGGDTCPSGRFCVQGDANALYDRCVAAVCSPSRQTGCAGGDRCVVTDSPDGTLQASCTSNVGSNLPGEACGNAADPYCVAGAQCFPQMEGTFVCMAFCDADEQAGCDGSPCLSFSDSGLQGLPDNEGICYQ